MASALLPPQCGARAGASSRRQRRGPLWRISRASRRPRVSGVACMGNAAILGALASASLPAISASPSGLPPRSHFVWAPAPKLTALRGHSARPDAVGTGSSAPLQSPEGAVARRRRHTIAGDGLIRPESGKGRSDERDCAPSARPAFTGRFRRWHGARAGLRAGRRAGCGARVQASHRVRGRAASRTGSRCR